MKTIPRIYLVVCLLLIEAIFLIAGSLAYRKYHEGFSNVQISNQQKITRVINQSLKLYFDKLRFITENAVLQSAFNSQSNLKEDLLRYQNYKSKNILEEARAQGISKILENPKKAVDIKDASADLKYWQVYKALPEFDSVGRPVAYERRLISRNILKAFEDIHYVFEMNTNGDLVFLEPFEIQKNVTSFNYEYRDYLQLVKKHRTSVISEGYISHDVQRTQIITVASPVFDSTNKIVKVFAASVSASTLREKVFQSLKESMELQDGTVFYLVDRHGHVVASSSGKNIYFPIEGNKNDESDQGNLRYTGFFKGIEWATDTLERGNVWERGTKSWEFSALKPDYSGRYLNLSGQEVFGTFYPTAISGTSAQNWGILIETPVAQMLSAEKSLKIVFVIASAILLLLLLILCGIIFKNIRVLESQLDAKEQENIQSAAQVAHDIRSPLAALEFLSQASERLPEEEKVMVRSAVGRMRDIANQLVSKSKPSIVSANQQTIVGNSRKHTAESREVALLSSLIDSVVSEKRLQFRNRPEVEIQFHLDSKSYGVFSDVKSSELKRIISNLINNSVEAIENIGSVEVSLMKDDLNVIITVKDTGKGIPPEAMNHMGELGATFGKPNGSGLGLYHAKTHIDDWGGKIEFPSSITGTTVKVFLPTSETPPWFVDSIVVQFNSTLVILDDDPSIHQVWNSRFTGEALKEGKVSKLHFTSPEQLVAWVRDHGATGRRLYLIDYELLGTNQNGVDLISQLGIQHESILISSRCEELYVKQKCAALSIKLIPKASAGIVPITFVDIRVRRA